jgi:excisionase family DNA binding protein
MSKTETGISRYISVTEAALRLGMSRKTIYGWTASGVLPSAKIGSRILIPIDEFKRALEEGRRHQTA